MSMLPWLGGWVAGCTPLVVWWGYACTLLKTQRVCMCMCSGNAAIWVFVSACGVRTGRALAILLASNFFLGGAHVADASLRLEEAAAVTTAA
jgi:hypothetical protein